MDNMLFAPEVPEILSPICDFIFKLLFGEQKNKRILVDFLKSVLDIPDYEFEDLTFPNPAVNKQFSDGKLSTLDVLIKTKNGQFINIEIQLQTHEAFTDRIAAYNDLIFVQIVREGMKYTGLKRTISIVIVDFNLFKDSEHYRHDFYWCEPGTLLKFTEKQEIHTLELRKLPQQPDNVKLCDWLKFLKAETKEELEMVAQKNTAINEAYAELLRISSDEDQRLLYCRWLIDQFDIHQREHDAEQREKRWREGEQRERETEQRVREAERKLREGEQKLRETEQRVRETEQRVREAEQKLLEAEHNSALKIAESLLELGDDTDKIAKITNLTREEIEALRT